MRLPLLPPSSLSREQQELYDDIMSVVKGKSWLGRTVRSSGRSMPFADSITPGMKEVTHSPHLPAGPAGFGPQVSFARSGITLHWDAKCRSLLELAEACDVPVRWSCRTGVCHTCETALIAGNVEYDPEPLDPPARGDALICCCRSRDEVVLDL